MKFKEKTPAQSFLDPVLHMTALHDCQGGVHINKKGGR